MPADKKDTIVIACCDDGSDWGGVYVNGVCNAVGHVDYLTEKALELAGVRTRTYPKDQLMPEYVDGKRNFRVVVDTLP